MKIEIKNVSYQYPNGILALIDLSLQIPEGQHIVLVGHNGCGKTTLARCLMGLIQPTSGEIFLNKRSVRKVKSSTLAREVSFVFQHPDDQIFHRTVYQEIAFGPKNLNFDVEKMKANVENALSLTGLTKENGTHPYDLGMSARKRITIASSLAMDTDVIIFDEPTSGMDAHEMGFMQGIYYYLKTAGKTVITITHDMDMAVENADRLAIMSHGRIIHIGNPVALFAELDGSASEIVAPQMVRLSKQVFKDHVAGTVDQFVSLLSE